MKRFLSLCVRMPRVHSAVGLITIMAVAAAFPRHAIADAIYVYDNLSNSQNGGDRINTPGRGLSQGFVATTSGSLATVAFGLVPQNATTGDLKYALYNVVGNGPYGLGSQIGSTGLFSISDVTSGFTYRDLRPLGWELVSGNKYAVALWSEATNWNNPDGSAGGLLWNGGVSSADNTTVFNNWDVAVASWEDWGNATTGFSLGLSTQVVPEPSTHAMALAGLACGGYSLFRRRRAR
ncbi:MAG: PEP-CTERM sorting domain-containing protein [Planctomycetaceae bacterium]